MPREGQTFPRLSEDMARRVAHYGSEELLKAGDIVFERGQRSVDFFLVLGDSLRRNRHGGAALPGRGSRGRRRRQVVVQAIHLFLNPGVA
jgi:hypothetical protein